MDEHRSTKLLNIVEALDRVHGVVGLYIGRKDDVDGVVNFLQGFREACDVLGLRYGVEVERQVFSENGWERRANGVWVQMRESGMSEEVIVIELVRLEILKWQKLLSEVNSK